MNSLSTCSSPLLPTSYTCTCKIMYILVGEFLCLHTAMVDGREVSDTERQFLARWKATRKARRKALQQSTDLQGTS